MKRQNYGSGKAWLKRAVLLVAATATLGGCVVYGPGPYAYAPRPAYYGPPVAVGVWGGYHWR